MKQAGIATKIITERALWIVLRIDTYLSPSGYSMNTKTYANYTSFLFPLFPFLPFFFPFPPSISFYLSHSHTFSVPSSPPLLFIFPYSKFPSDLPSSISLRHLSFLSHTLLLVLFHFLFSHLFSLSRLFPFYLVYVFSLFILFLSVYLYLFLPPYISSPISP